MRICEAQRGLTSLNFWSISDVLSFKKMQVFKVTSLSQFKISWLPCEDILRISVWQWYLFKLHMSAFIRKWNLNIKTQYVWTASCKSVITNMATMRCFDTYYSMEQGPPWGANEFSISQEFPAFYGTRRFITAFTSARHLSLFWTSSIQSIPPHPTFWRYILIWFSHLRLGLLSGLRFTHQKSV